MSISLLLILNKILFLGYYELVNGTVNNVSYKSNYDSLAQLKKVGREKEELFQTAKVNGQEAW